MPNKVTAATRLYPAVTPAVVLNAGVGIFFSALFFFVFVPQHLECYRRKSTAGLSPWLLLFGGISFMFAFYNVLLLDLDTLGVCHGDDKYKPEVYNCIAAASPILQQLLPAVTGYPTWYIWFHLYCPPELREQHIISLCLFLTTAFIGAAISLYVLFLQDRELTLFVGTTWGVIATITNFIMWFPQIETTIRLKSRGALSVSMLISTIISDIVFTLYLYVLARQHWSVWLPQVPDAFQQMLLLALLWHYGDLGTAEPNYISPSLLSSSTSMISMKPGYRALASSELVVHRHTHGAVRANVSFSSKATNGDSSNVVVAVTSSADENGGKYRPMKRLVKS
mmetsp:Transcript_13691/g.18977  ORF Transcript_13691/g.18977 Transcript_13691/m.18977 type:complete len:338 (-) Transcript_13691:142-1155(-)